MVRQMRRLIPPHLRSWERPEVDASTAPAKPASNMLDSSVDMGRPLPSRHPSYTGSHHEDSFASDADHQKLLEGPPIDDFEWSERDPVPPRALSPGGEPGTKDESPISDGMATLTVDEKETGYLGIASGAALVRLLGHDNRRRVASRMHAGHAGMHPLTSQPNPNRHVAESMIDSYFRIYHVSYPLIHEPTFRAQYSEVIPRPHGPSWTILAYIVAAVGVWCSATSNTDTLDLALFSEARSMLTFSYLETGNLTLLQALTLATNYQQKRDKPNSAYNYLGLSTRMAMGLGLHKEFQGWNISPLNMEIRRRVWWTLCVFDVGASITFSRPNVWPYQGVEVSFPLNVNDKVRNKQIECLDHVLLTSRKGSHRSIERVPGREQADDVLHGCRDTGAFPHGYV